MQGDNMYTIPAGAHAEYNTNGQFSGYFTSSAMQGGIAEYNDINGVNTITGYHVPLNMLSPTSVSSGSMMGGSSSSMSGGESVSSNCNPVSPVPNGIPQYNHHGCITGYVLKNSNLMMLI
jgi:hypothetical protein